MQESSADFVLRVSDRPDQIVHRCKREKGREKQASFSRWPLPTQRKHDSTLISKYGAQYLRSNQQLFTHYGSGAAVLCIYCSRHAMFDTPHKQQLPSYRGRTHEHTCAPVQLDGDDTGALRSLIRSIFYNSISRTQYQVDPVPNPGTLPYLNSSSQRGNRVLDIARHRGTRSTHDGCRPSSHFSTCCCCKPRPDTNEEGACQRNMPQQ